MRQYEIYLIEEEFASHYFGRESKIYQLFMDYNLTNSKKKILLRSQIHCITKKIPSLIIHQLLEAKLRNRQDYCVTQHIHQIEVSNGRGKAELAIHDRFISIKASGTYEAETTFFEILRKYSSCFLAMDYVHNRYGWLNPIKMRKFV